MKKLLIFFLSSIFYVSCTTPIKKLETPSIKSLVGKEEKKNFDIALSYAQAYESSSYTNKDNYNKALLYFKRAISEDKTNYFAWYNIARIYFYDGNYSNTRKSLVKTLELNNAFIEAYTLYVKSYLAEGNIEEARNVVDKAKSLVPGNRIIKYLEAYIFLKQNQYKEASDISREIIRNNPTFSPAYILLGNVYYLEGKTEFARLIYNKALEIKDVYGSVYSNLGIINLELQEKNEAVINLKQAVEKAPSSAYSHLNISKIYIDAGDYEGALNEIKIAVKIFPKFSEAYNNMGIVYMRMSLFEDAKKSFEKGIEIDSNNADVYFNYALLLDDYFTDSDKALENYKKYIEIKGSDIKNNDRVYSYIETIERKKTKRTKTKWEAW